MRPQLGQDGGRHLDHPGPVCLRVPLEQHAPVLGHAPLHGQPAQVVKMPAAEGEGFAGTQAAVGEHEEEGPPPRIDGSSKGFDLLDRQGVAGPTRTLRQPEAGQGIAGDDAGVRGRGQHHAEDGAGGMDGRVRVAGRPENAQPLLHVDAS